MSKADFLLEIGTEELPSRFIGLLSNQLITKIKKQLSEKQIMFEEAKSYSTARRLAVLITGLPLERPSYVEKKQGPNSKVAFDVDGNPTKAALGFAASCGVDIQDLEQEKTPKGEKLVYSQEIEQQPLEDVLALLIVEVVNDFELPKIMRWGDQKHEFIRPVHWLVALFNQKIIEVELFGIKASNMTFGHRVYSSKPIKITDEKEYENILDSNKVIVDPAKRKSIIREQIDQALEPYNAICNIKDDLLEDVVGLVESPVVMLGTFEEKFLSLPKEVLICTIEKHQKCFPVENEEKKLLAKFIMVSNISPKDRILILSGNENVMKARLSDAEFFYTRDLSKSLVEYQNKLSSVLFHKKTGELAR